MSYNMTPQMALEFVKWFWENPFTEKEYEQDIYKQLVLVYSHACGILTSNPSVVVPKEFMKEID